MLQPSYILGSGCHTSTVDIGNVDFGAVRRFSKQVLHDSLSVGDSVVLQVGDVEICEVDAGEAKEKIAAFLRRRCSNCSCHSEPNAAEESARGICENIQAAAICVYPLFDAAGE
jgi:hypothetical protein